MGTSLKMRLLTAIIGVPLVILVLLAPKHIMTVIVMTASVMGLYEYYKAVGLSVHRDACIMGYIAALVISAGANYPTAVSVVLVYVFIISLFIMMLMRNRTIGIVHIGMLLLGLIYIPYFLSHVIYIRSLEFGNFYVWLVFIGAFLTDTCAYFIGCRFGKHKLCPTISPNKTVEGAIGGIVGGGLAFVLFGIIVNVFFAKYLDGKHFSLILLFVLGIISAIASEIGDLVASSIKRQFNIKDFGNLLPGHGGILDRCDSIILVAPIIFLFLYNICIVV
ncbi:MAG: phosphatidate cytidylyltransferase [Clostridia bacterium]|nr:phosphatidate cytidylyltransferase [Clostridia bacterium]